MRVLAWDGRGYGAFAEARRRWGDPFAYEGAWLYVCQALRRGGWIVASDRGWLAVAKGYVGRDRHAIVVPLADRPVDFVQEGMRELAKAGIAIKVVKHVREELAADFVGLGTFEVASVTSPASLGNLDDISEDTYPQVMVQVGTPSWRPERHPLHPLARESLGGPEAGDFRYQVRRFWRRRVQRNEVVAIEDFRTLRGQDYGELLSGWLESLRGRYRSTDRPRVVNFDTTFRDPVVAVVDAALTTSAHVIGEAIRVDGVWRALWLGERVSKDCLGVYVLLADTRIQNLSDFTLLRALVGARTSGAQFANLGGSELSTLFAFKSKPIRTRGTGERVRRVRDLIVRA